MMTQARCRSNILSGEQSRFIKGHYIFVGSNKIYGSKTAESFTHTGNQVIIEESPWKINTKTNTRFNSESPRGVGGGGELGLKDDWRRVFY